LTNGDAGPRDRPPGVGENIWVPSGDCSYVNAQNDTRILSQAGRKLGLEIAFQHASTTDEIDLAFAAFAQQQVSAVLVHSDPYYVNRRDQLAGLAARYVLPAIYGLREHAVAGGLVSYGTDLTEAYHEVGTIVARILKGEAPGDIPVQQPTKFQMVVNMKTAKTLGMDVPESILVRADEVCPTSAPMRQI
jgi:putative ABC transport system substrate-binding protein